MRSSSIFDKENDIDWLALSRSLDWTPVRQERQLEDWMLTANAADWLKSLPAGVRPVLLQKRFPRIANKLCHLRNRSDELAAYFTSLLRDTRGTRQGFPALVVEELRALQAHARAHARGARWEV